MGVIRVSPAGCSASSPDPSLRRARQYGLGCDKMDPSLVSRIGLNGRVDLFSDEHCTWELTRSQKTPLPQCPAPRTWTCAVRDRSPATRGKQICRHARGHDMHRPHYHHPQVSTRHVAGKRKPTTGSGRRARSGSLNRVAIHQDMAWEIPIQMALRNPVLRCYLPNSFISSPFLY